jgi:hypothetical protein
MRAIVVKSLSPERLETFKADPENKTNNLRTSSSDLARKSWTEGVL